MNGDEATTAARLDVYLDALVRGRRPEDDGFDSALAATVRRVHARPVAPAPDAAYAERLWRELAACEPAGRGVGRSAAVGSIGIVPWSLAGRGSGVSVRLRGSRALANLATAAVVLVTLVG